MAINRFKMCKNKVSFTNAKAAERIAEKHNQRVYECPICFCFHCTSKADWKDEFVTLEKYQNVMKANDRLIKQIQNLSKVKQRLNEMRQLNFKLLKIIKRKKISDTALPTL